MDAYARTIFDSNTNAVAISQFLSIFLAISLPNVDSDFVANFDSHTYADVVTYAETYVDADFDANVVSHSLPHVEADSCANIGSDVHADFVAYIDSNINAHFDAVDVPHIDTDGDPDNLANVNSDVETYSVSDTSAHSVSDTLADGEPHAGPHASTDSWNCTHWTESKREVGVHTESGDYMSYLDRRSRLRSSPADVYGRLFGPVRRHHRFVHLRVPH